MSCKIKRNTLTHWLLCSLQLEEEQSIKNASDWFMNEYYANFSRLVNDTEATPPPLDPADVIRGPCWETAVGIVMKIKADLITNIQRTLHRHIVFLYTFVTKKSVE